MNRIRPPRRRVHAIGRPLSPSTAGHHVLGGGLGWVAVGSAGPRVRPRTTVSRPVSGTRPFKQIACHRTPPSSCNRERPIPALEAVDPEILVVDLPLHRDEPLGPTRAAIIEQPAAVTLESPKTTKVPPARHRPTRAVGRWGRTARRTGVLRLYRIMSAQAHSGRRPSFAPVRRLAQLCPDGRPVRFTCPIVRVPGLRDADPGSRLACPSGSLRRG